MEMINRHPQSISESKRTALSDAIDSCLSCAQACTACSDACLGEKEPEKFRSTIRSTTDCSDICLAMAKILSRLNTPNPTLIKSLIISTINQIQDTENRCREHSFHHEHCRVCSDACRVCENSLSEYKNLIE